MKEIIRNKNIIILILIVLLGAFLRLYRIRELGTFRGDQAIELSGAADILEGKFRLIGIKTSISEIHNGAVMYYMLAPFLFIFNYDPVAGSTLQTILSLSSIILIYMISRLYLSEKKALLASFFLSASSLLVHYSRQTLLAQYPLFFCGLAIYLFLRIVKKFQISYCLFLGFLMGFMLQIHYSTIVVLFCMIITPFFLLERRRLLIYFLCIFLGFAIGLTPIILFEFRHEFFNSKMLLSFFSHQTESTIVYFNQLNYWLDVLTSLFFGGNKLITIPYLFTLIYGLITFRHKITDLEKILIIQIFIMIVFTIFFVRISVLHYAIAAFIPIFILSSNIIIELANKYFRKLANLIVFLLFMIFFTTQIPSLGLSDNHGWNMTPGWTMPAAKKTAQIIMQDIGKNKYNVAMLIDAENQGLPLRYFLEFGNNLPLMINEYDKADFLYIAVEPDLDLQKVDMYEIHAFGGYQIGKVWDVKDGIRLYRLDKKS